MLRFVREFVAVWAVSILILTSASAVSVFVSADAVYAKHGDKGKGGGKGGGRKGGDRGADRKGGDREKGDRYGNKDHDRKGGKHRADGKYGKHHGKHHAKYGHGYSKKHKGWHDKKYRDKYKGRYGKKYSNKYDRKRGEHAFAGFKRDMRRFFDGDARERRRYSADGGYRYKQRVRKIDESVRPKKRRDPLFAAITDRNGDDKLRNLNAAKASPVAFRNASPNSNVGKIAAYQASAQDYYDSRERLLRRKARLERLEENYDGRSSEEVVSDIDALDPESDTYEDDLAALEKELDEAEAFESDRQRLQKGVVAAKRDVVDSGKQAEDDFFEASKGREVTPKVLSQLNRILGLPTPKKRLEPEQPSDLASAD